jgi:uncharacterized DUF497 family protein
VLGESLIPSNLEFEWDEKKSEIVKQRHGKSLKEISHYITSGNVVAFRKHFNQESYPGQMLIVVNVEGYPWAVPCEIRGNKLRLITAYPSRKFKRLLER